MNRNLILLFTFAAHLLPASAADIHWVNPDNGRWSSSTNWDTGKNTASETVIIDNGGTAIIGTGEIGSGDTITIGRDSSGHVLVESGGQLGLGWNPIFIAGNKGSSGSVTLNQGALEAGSLHVGNNGTGTLTLNGGKVTTAAWNTFTIGTYEGTGTVTINDNGIVQSATDIRVGAYGTGELILNSGLVQTGWQVIIGEGGNAKGTVTINGGMLQTGSYEGGHGGSQPGDIFVGSHGTGILDINNDGIARSTGWTFIGGNQNQGAKGNGTLTVSDTGRLETAKQLYVGLDGTGTLNITDSSVAETQGNARIGVYSNGSGTVNVSGNGSMTNRAELWVGERTSGIINIQDSGTVSAGGKIGLGIHAGSTGEINVNGGHFETSSNLHIGINGTGTLNQTGGNTLVTGNIQIGDGAGSLGTLNLSGGTLETTSFSKGAGSGTINLTGGTLRARQNHSDFFSGFSQVSITGTGAAFDSNGHDVTINTQLNGGGKFNKTGLGTLTLNADSSLGAVTIQQGTLAVAAQRRLDATALNVATGGTLHLGGNAEIGASAVATDMLTLNDTAHIILNPQFSALHAGTLDLENLASGGKIAISLLDFQGLFAGEFLEVFTFDAVAGDYGSGLDAGKYFSLANGDGSQYAFMWSDNNSLLLVAVPEPGTYGIMVGAALLAFVGIKRHRRRS